MIKILTTLLFVSCFTSTEKELKDNYCWVDSNGNSVCGYESKEHCQVVIDVTKTGYCYKRD